MRTNVTRQFRSRQWRIQDFCKGGAAVGAFGVPQAPSCPLSLRRLRNFVGASCKVKIAVSYTHLTLPTTPYV